MPRGGDPRQRCLFLAWVFMFWAGSSSFHLPRCLSLWLYFPPCGPASTDCDLLLFFQNLTVCPEEESVIMSSFVSTLSSLNLKQGKW